jgi:hypothetical protein
MTRFLALLLLALASPAAAQAQRNFTITSFDRIRVEAPFDVTVTTGKAPSARAEGAAAAIDTVDLRVEGRTLIVRQRSGWNGAGRDVPLRLSLGTPDLRAANLVGVGRLSVDRLRGLSVVLGLAGPGQMRIGDLQADQVDLIAAGSGSVALAGTVKKARVGAEGNAIVDAAALQSDDLVLVATGSSEVRAHARRTANVTASGAAAVAMTTAVSCIRKVTGAATVSNCR